MLNHHAMRLQAKRVGLFFVSIITIVGCASTNVMKLSEAEYEAKDENCSLQVFEQKPKQKYEEIAVVKASHDDAIFSSDGEEAILPDLKRKACLQGADAIILKDAHMGSNWSANSHHAEASATAIKFL